MEEEGSLHYYLQDELGSPLRVSGYGAGKETADIRNEYLTYGYDEFGNDLYKELEDAGIPCPYDRQGEEQPFGYTGYRFDDVSGTYFAQAREYQVGNGRFTAEDLVKGNGAELGTLNRYGYCLQNPNKYVDLDGKNPMQTLNEATYMASQLAQLDGPLIIGDIIGLGIVAGAAIYVGGTYIVEYVGQTIENVKEKTKEKAVAIERTEDGQTIIYRLGSGNHTNFTPRPGIDMGGLSYQYTKPVGSAYHMTTIEAVNATGVLTAVPDGPNHISVIPIDESQLLPWMNTREGVKNNGMGEVHPYTYLMEGITIAYFNKKGLPTEPGWINDEKARGNCPSD